MSAHGTASRYNNDGCRCRPCKDAWATHMARMRANRRSRLLGESPLPRANARTGPKQHGTHSAYSNWGCRCDKCCLAHLLDQRERRGQQPFHAAECGTHSGYGAHRRRGDEACQPCKRAHADYENARRKARAA
jgi:hypothetical protein